ncbi:protein FAM81B [Dicentrarchus labrax]|uniref:Family with sequence similarity 81 member B n=1 Tax=Dicentrarchus labrax TaxID=13489 RepID=A0A8P4KIN3_DICLA|nr:protein FAM81B [Dicentrarchus labrax]XP_051279737.1 protein FAM81B [Dicentrarchus labrax]
MSHESRLQPYHNHTSPDASKGCLSSQEKTLALLLEQAFRIKEEVAAGLQSTQGSIQVEAFSRKLLENHILTITRIVKQLSMDIQALERLIIQRDSITSGTTEAVQSLDQKNMAGIGDLRGRVARCDASISKLSADVSSGERQLIRLQQEVAELRSAVDVWLKELEVKVYRDMGRLEASLSEHSQGQRSSMSDLHTQVKLLESKMSDELKEAREQTDLLRKWTEQQINSSVQHCTQHHDKMLKATSALADRLHALEARVEQFETQLGRANRSQGDQLKRSETKLSKRMTSVESNLHQELQLLKQEYDKGFLSVHDAIESLRQISDIKSRLDKEKLQKDIRHICSKVTELNDL